MVENKNIKGITLISLVITIVIMLILATVSINLILGNNGLFSKTSQSANAYKLANAEEKVSLAVSASYDTETKLNTDELKDNINKIDGLKTKVDSVTYDLKINVDGFDFIINEVGNVTSLGKNNELPENSFDHPQDMGKEVAIKDKWGQDSVSYIKTINGVEVTNVSKIATVYGIADGEGETVPVPQKFYYVGGTFNTGVIISDNEDDKFDGNTDKTTYEYARNLKGNQFVWIPCTKDSYKKTEFNTIVNSSAISVYEENQVDKYGGFYIARYEAGLASSIPEFTTPQIHNGSNPIYNKDGVPQSKAGIAPWVFIDWTHANKNARSMYNTSYVSSGLVTGAEWDTCLNKIVEKTDVTTDNLNKSNSWGNYSDNAATYNGRIANTYIASNSWYTAPFGDETNSTDTPNNSGTYNLFTTGACKEAEKYHIFDLAGNVWEMTAETSCYSTSEQCYMSRGGSYRDSYNSFGASFRAGDNNKTYTGNHYGFRVALYIK